MNPAFLSSAAPWLFDVLTHLWQSTVVAIGILVLLKLGRRLSAHTRRTLGWIAIAKFALPAAWILELVERTGASPQPWLSSEAFLVPVALPAALPLQIEAPPLFSMAQLIVIAWGTVAGILLARWMIRAVRARRRILAGATPASAAIGVRLAPSARHAGLAAMPRCVIVRDRQSPSVVGFVHPVLVLPQGLLDGLSPAELEAILLHECVHLRRRDNFWAAARAAFVGVLWFNPVAWWLNRVIALETEKSCDERVLELTGDPKAYASGIVAAVRYSLGVTGAGISGVTTPPVLRRIQAILAYRARPERRLLRLAAMLAGIGLVALAGKTGSIAAAETKTATAAPAPASAAAVEPASALPPTGKRADEATLSIDFPEEDIRKVIRNVADLFQLNVIMPDTLKGKTSVKLRDVTWRQIFKIVLEQHGYDFVEEDGMVKIFQKSASRASLTPPNVEEDRRAVRAARELADALARAAAANEELRKLRDERDAAIAREKTLLEARDKASAPPPFKIGRLSIKFLGESSVSEESVRAMLQTKVGENLDEKTLDGDIRTLYRTGEFKSIEVRHRSAAGGSLDLVIELTPNLAPAPSAQVSASAPQLPAVAFGSEQSYRGLKVFDIAEVEQPPVAVFQARPQYPFEMRRNRVEGDVVVDFIVDPEGNVANARAIRSSREEFEPAAVTAVSKWKFKPARKGGREVPTHMQMPIVFTIRD